MYISTHDKRRRHLNTTEHARKRQQQRSIPTSVVDLLFDFGDERPVGDGSTSYAFSKKSWKRVVTYLGTEAKYFERYRDCYLVAANNGMIITVAYIQ